MFALFLTEHAVRFVLQEDMARLLHVTIDDTKWNESFEHFGITTYHKSEISGSVLCQNAKIIGVDAEIVLLKQRCGDWVTISSGCEGYRIRFSSCQELKAFWIYFNVDPVTGVIGEGAVWLERVSTERFKHPQDKAVLNVRAKILA